MSCAYLILVVHEWCIVLAEKKRNAKVLFITFTHEEKNRFIFNTSIVGGNRAIVPINSYEEVIPMDILVTQLLKSLVVADTEMAIDLGML